MSEQDEGTLGAAQLPTEEVEATPQPQASQEQQPPPATEPTSQEGDKPQIQETPAQKEPPPVPKPAPEFRVVKAGYIQRQGLLWKKWNRQWMTLDEDGEALRWYRNENREGSDGALYMKVCADVCEPREGATTNWPEGSSPDQCFVICSPHRAFYIVSESAEDKREWIERLTEAQKKFNTKGVKVVSLDLFSVDAIKKSLMAAADEAQTDTDKMLAEHGTSTDKIGQDLDKTAKQAENELKSAEQVTEAAEQAEQQVQSEVREGECGEKVEVKVDVEVGEEGGVEVKAVVKEEGTGGGEEVEGKVEVTEEPQEEQTTEAPNEEEEKKEE